MVFKDDIFPAVNHLEEQYVYRSEYWWNAFSGIGDFISLFFGIGTAPVK